MGGEMAQLLVLNQESYVPCIKLNGKPEVLVEIPLHWDQLFEKRARNAQRGIKDGNSKYEKLEGLTTEAQRIGMPK